MPVPPVASPAPRWSHRPGISSGHMPGATSIPFTELVEDGRLKPAEQLREIFTAKGVDLKQPITTTCGSGVTAAVIALGLEIAGANRVSLYDGSWAEYAQHPEAVIEKNRLNICVDVPQLNRMDDPSRSNHWKPGASTTLFGSGRMTILFACRCGIPPLPQNCHPLS